MQTRSSQDSDESRDAEEDVEGLGEVISGLWVGRSFLKNVLPQISQAHEADTSKRRERNGLGTEKARR